MNILFFVFIPLWLLAITKEALFWIYFWQLKEYRQDRMRAHFALPTARVLLINNKVSIVAVLFVTAIIALTVPILPIILGIGAILFYILGAYRIYIHIHEKQLRIPAFTMKALILLVLTGILYIAILSIALARTPEVAFVLLLASDLLVPVAVTAFVALFNPVSVMMKRRISKRARKKRENLKDLLVVGITGSYGKTSTKDFLAHILDKSFRVHKTPENINTEIGIARDFLANVTPSHDIYIAEVGAYKIGEIAAVADIIKPNISVLTGISNQHIALFGSQENVAKAKHELIDALGANGLAIFNGDNRETRELFVAYRRAKRLYTSELPEKGVYSGIFAKNIRYKGDGTTLEITDRQETVRMETSLLGYANAINILGAAVTARALGMSLKNIAKQVKTLSAPPRTMEPRRGIKGTRVIDDSYSGNYEGVLSALEVLSNAEGNKKICILHPLIELGEEAARIHKELGKKIGETCDVCIVTTGDFFTELRTGAIAAGIDSGAIMQISDPYLAMRKAQELIEEGDVILLENRIPEQVRKGIIL